MSTNDMNRTHLVSLLWDSSDEGNEYVCCMEQIEAFVSNKIDNEDLEGNEDLMEVTIPDEEADGYVYEFKRWLEDNPEEVITVEDPRFIAAMQEAVYQGFDGWEPTEKKVIEAFLADVTKAARTM